MSVVMSISRTVQVVRFSRVIKIKLKQLKRERERKKMRANDLKSKISKKPRDKITKNKN